ncbi:hypothetical protein A4G18_00405 [Pasteurellaceae bacterium Pebbles2]|nr:hypothetical protein [Pasteurellaceae bacterium Pebbles2]
MADFATLGIKIKTDGATKANDDLRSIQAQAGATEKSVSALSNMMARLKSLLALGIGFQTISVFVQMADKMKTLASQVRFVTRTTEEFNAVQKELFNISQNTRASLEATTTLYIRSARALQGYGYSQKRVLDFTETINKAMAIGGVGAQEQSTALFQLSQALGSGRLQGDEFRAISEAAPILLDIVANYMGKTRAEVKKLASDGKLTSQILFEAISGASQKISEDFKKVPVTFGQAMTQMHNAVLKFISDFDTSSGITGMLASFVSLLATNFSLLAKTLIYATAAYAAFNIVSLAANFKAATNGVGLLTFGFRSLTLAVRGATVAMLANPLGLIAAAIVGVIYVFDQFISKMEIGFGAFNATWGDVAAGIWEDFKNVAVNVWEVVTNYIDTSITMIASSFGSAISDIGELFGFLVDIAKSVVNGVIGIFDFGYQALILIWNNFPVAMEAIAKGAANVLVTIFEEAVNFLMNKLKSLLRLVNQALDSVGMEGFDLSSMEVKLPKFEVSQAARDFKTQINSVIDEVGSTDYLGKLGSNIENYIMLAGAKGKILNKSEEKQNADLSTATQKTIADSQGDELKKKKRGRERKNHGRTAVEEMREWIANQKQKIQAQTDELRMIGMLESEKTKLNEINQLEMDYQKQLISTSPELRGELSAQYELIKKQLTEMQSFREQTRSDPMAGIKDGFAKFGDRAMDVMGNVSQITQDALNGMGDALTDFVLTGKADFKSLATSIIKDITSMMIKMMLFNALKSSLSGTTLGGWLGFSQGGLVGFDVGGFTGYGGKYDPAGIVHKGEYVLTKEATSRLGIDYLDHLNYKSRSKPIGFANGGGVNIPTLSAVNGNNNVSVKIINNGEPVNANVHTEQNGGQTEITVELLKQMDKIADNRYRQNQMNDMRNGNVLSALTA